MINLLHRLKDNKFLIFFIILAFISIIIISGPKFAYQSFFWQDFKYFEVIHNLSLKKTSLVFYQEHKQLMELQLHFLNLF